MQHTMTRQFSDESSSVLSLRERGAENYIIAGGARSEKWSTLRVATPWASVESSVIAVLVGRSMCSATTAARAIYIARAARVLNCSDECVWLGCSAEPEYRCEW